MLHAAGAYICVNSDSEISTISPLIINREIKRYKIRPLRGYGNGFEKVPTYRKSKTSSFRALDGSVSVPT